MKLHPRLNEGTYVFASVSDISILSSNDIIASIKEREGWSIVIEKSRAIELAIPIDYEAAWITLDLNSELDYVGMTAKFSATLSQKDISCNVVAGFHHDHLFVGVADAERALKVLAEVIL